MMLFADVGTHVDHCRKKTKDQNLRRYGRKERCKNSDDSGNTERAQRHFMDQVHPKEEYPDEEPGDPHSADQRKGAHWRIDHLSNDLCSFHDHDYITVGAILELNFYRTVFYVTRPAAKVEERESQEGE